MQRKAFLKVAVSSLIVATTMVGCSGAHMTSRAGITAPEGDATKFAATAEKALAAKDGAKAVQAAEAAVGIDANNGVYRTLLGRAYLLDGRYASAETSFSDALILGNRDARTVISLALVQVAAGKFESARVTLADNRDVVPATDYGLAVAMAGDADEGVRILGDAARSPDATAKTRQNLAYAYALANRWSEAKLMASQDLSPDLVRARMIQWASSARTGAEAQRVAALIGVSPRGDDTGLPVRLALNSNSGAPVQVAAADPATAVPVTTPEAPSAIATFAEPPASQASVRTIETSAPIVETAVAAPAAQPAPQPGMTVLAAAPRASKTPRVAAAAPTRVQARPVAYMPAIKGGYQVQLGAFDSAAVARDSFATIARHNAEVGRYAAIHTKATVRGRLFYRVAVGGFSDRATAFALCQGIRAQGGRCFVRGASSAETQRWAAARPVRATRVQLASR